MMSTKTKKDRVEFDEQANAYVWHVGSDLIYLAAQTLKEAKEEVLEYKKERQYMGSNSN